MYLCCTNSLQNYKKKFFIINTYIGKSIFSCELYWRFKKIMYLCTRIIKGCPLM